MGFRSPFVDKDKPSPQPGPEYIGTQDIPGMERG
jgi:hypothetical protein